MPLNRRAFIASTAALATTSRIAFAQGFPSRPISVVVGAAPGGPNDIVARMVSDRLSKKLGVSIVIDNTPGGSGFIAASDVKAANPDGYRLLFAYTGLLAVNPWLFKSLPYDPNKDFVPLSLVAKVPQVLLVGPQLGVKTFDELVDWLRNHPSEAAYGSAGNGTPLHIAGELFLERAGVRAVHIPYKGSSPAYPDLLSGRLQFMFDGVPGVLGFIKSGQMLALATTGTSRHPLLPEVPTLAEAGLKDAEVESWMGFAAPAGTPAAVTSRLSEALVEIMQEPELRQRLEAQAVQPWGTSAAEMDSYVEKDRQRWKGLVANAGISPT